LTIGDDTTFTVDDQLSNSGVIEFAGLGTLTLSGSVVNSGEIETGSHSINGVAPLDFILLEGDVNISGSGKIVLSDPADIFAAKVGPPSTLTLSSEIDGVGDISGMKLDILAGPGGIIADGSVSDANPATNPDADTLTIDAAGPITNDDVLAATNSGVLVIKNDVDNMGQYATLNASGGTIDIDGITVYGGLLQTSDTGSITADNATLDGATDGPLTNTGAVTLDNSGSSLTLTGSIENDGTIALTAADEKLIVDGNVSLGVTYNFVPAIGTGVLLEGESDQISGQGALTLASGLTGVGTINLPGGITIDAGGFILADADDDTSAQSGATLTIAKGGAITNGGVLGAFGRPPATLIIENNVDNVGSGEISAASSVPSAEVVISGVTITSGTIATNTDGSIEADNSTLNGVDIEGIVNLGTAGASLTLEGVIGLNSDDNVLNGTINFNAKSQTLVINGNVSVSGPGEINLIDADDLVESEGTFTKAKNSPSSLTLNSEIAGEGTIGDAQLTLTVRSEGKIVAQGSNALILNTGANTITNAGTLETGGGELVIDSNVDNASGTIAAYSGDVEISGVTISGGAFAGQLLGGTLLESGSALDGTSQGVLTNKGALQIDKAQSMVTLEGAIDNADNISFNSQTQSLLVAGNVTLTGGGLVSMNDSSDKFVSNSHAATLSSSNQITGVGVIGDADTTLTISSGGSIVADPSHDLTATSGDTLTITTGANTIVNQGALEAQNGGTLQISSNINDASGTIEANGAVSIVALNGITVAGGTLSTSANGVIEADDNLTLDGASQGAISDNATVDLETEGATLTLTGVIANAGILDLAAQKQKVTLTGNLTLTGAGSVIMGDIGDTLLDSGSPTTLTVGNTIAGVGVIGDTRMTLAISQGGSIVATTADDVTTVSGNKLTIGYLAAGIVNDGELSAADGATLFVKDGVTGSGDATISGGRLELASAFSQQIQFTAGDAGALQIDDVTAFGSEILGFTTDDTINLSKVAYDPNGSVTLEAGNVLQVVENGTTYDFHLDPSQNFGGDKIVLSKDTTAGSDITVEAIPIVTQYIVAQATDAINPEVGKLGDLVVGLDAQTTDAMVGSGGELNIESGGVATGGSVDDGGVEYVQAGGSAQGAEIGDPGLQVVYAGGASTDTTISGGEQDVYGSAYSSDVQSSGLQVVEAKGVAYDTEVDTGGEQDIDGGADQGLYIDGGVVKVNDGGALEATTAVNAGTVLLKDAALSGSFYFGASGGVVEVAAGATVAGEIALAGDDATLRIDGGVLPTNVITGFGVGEGVLGLGEDAANNDVIDLANVAYDPNWTAALGPNNVLQIGEGGKTYDLNLDPTLSYVGFGFALTADSAGTGTAISVGVADAWANSAGGDWATSANWSEGTPTSNPSLTSDAVIALPKVKATIAASESETVGSLALDADDAVLNVAGELTVDLALSVAGGAALDLASGGVLTLSGTTTLASGTASGSPPDALTINGALTIGGLLINSSTVLEAGTGAVTLGASSGVAITNTSLGTWNISNDNGVALGAASVATISNAGLLEKSAGSGVSVIAASLSDSGTLTALTGTLELTGASNTIAGALRGPGTIEFAGASTTLVAGARASASHLTEAGAGTSLQLATNLTYVGALTVGAGATLTVDTGDTLTLTGRSLLNGTVNGPGALKMTGGAATLDGEVSVGGGWTSAGTALALDGALTAYAGAFTASAETISVNGATNLDGTNTLTGVTIDGVQHLRFFGLTTVAGGLTLGGSAALVNYSTVTQNSGAVTLGDSSGDAVAIFDEAGSTWNITDDSGIALGNKAASSVTNVGLLEKTGGSGASTIAAAVDNTGKIEAASGTLDFEGAIAGTGSDIVSGASTLEFDSTVASGQTIGFTGAGGTLDLGDPQGFSGKISGFDTVGGNDQLEIAAPWTYLSFSENAADTQGTLTFANGATHISLTLLGNYADDFIHQAGPGGSTLVTYA
jgi:autotransporter passenger strand-loop-strand repeat protein